MTRKEINRFQDIPNVGPAIAKDLVLLGFTDPQQLAGKDPYQMHADLCALTGVRQDPCVIDVFISVVRYMEGGPPRKWWEFTAERKQH
ncbi:MAG: mitomycin resistance protein, partial [Gammaproteobacteria bacterium]|nr:mitomycin resistance protein [Gammaproteobacteria bacterium]